MARIFNIQKYSVHDGPGIRTLVFFQGCPLRCLWCSNPEGRTAAPKVLWSRSLCAGCGSCVAVCPKHRHLLAADGHALIPGIPCDGCGACVAACTSRALALSGSEMTADEILSVVLEDAMFYRTSGGGVTLGGGEPLAQWREAKELLMACLDEGVGTAMETCGHAPAEALREVAPHVDLFLYDIKHMDSARHAALTGVGNERILENLAWLLDNGFRVRVRMPLVTGCNADEAEMRARAAWLAPRRDLPNFEGVDLLPYHRLGENKYRQMGEEPPLKGDGAVDEVRLAVLEDILASAGISTAVVRH